MKSIRLMLVLVVLSRVSLVCVAIDQSKIASFSADIKHACQAKDIESIKKLYYFDGVPERIIDSEIFKWEIWLLDLVAKRNWTVDGVEFLTKESYLSQPDVSQQDFANLSEPKRLNGHLYGPNLRVIGLVNVKFRQSEIVSVGQAFPVGIAPDGSLRFVADQLPLRPDDFAIDQSRMALFNLDSQRGGEAKDIQSIQKDSVGVPKRSIDQSKITAFCTNIQHAYEAKDIESIKKLYCFDGVPALEIDSTIQNWEDELRDSVANANWTVDGVEYFTKDAYLSRPDVCKQCCNLLEPKKMNGHFYGANLRIIGIVKVKIKQSKNLSSTDFLPIGIAPDGSLRIVAMKRIEWQTEK